MRSRWIAFAFAALLLDPGHASAQGATAQDSTLDHLVHPPGYVTSEPGTLGAVVERGRGASDVVLVSGFGLGASAFDDFMRRHAKRWHMLAVTLPGFEGSAAPPMPPAGTSYGEQSWTRDAAEAVARLIRDRGLRRPVLVGHFINGTQVAMRVARDHPELVRGVVLLAGTPRFEPATVMPFWPRDLSLDRKVAMVDRVLAPRWFKTVTRATWVTNNFKADDYSTDPARGKRFADLANAPPLPVLVRWLCEYHASDLWPELEKFPVPLLVVQPAFTPALRADSTRSYLGSYFEEPWKGRLPAGGRAERVPVEGAGILVMDDQPAIVDRAVIGFVTRLGR